MKIHTLKIHNIASIEDARIDFNAGPLAHDPLFLITGETGSGKTTILNAICMALYNQVPALCSIGSSEVDGEGIQTNNPRQLLSRGTGEGEIELTFSGNDEKTYRSVWRVQRAHKKVSGRYQNIERYLYVTDQSGEKAYTRIKEIDELIKNAIGLTFEQFTRTTLLAQGQFASFMKASSNDKSEILEKLTGTEVYARIGEKVFGLMQRKLDEFNAIDNQIKGASLLDDAQKEEMRGQIISLESKITERDKILALLETQINWLKEEIKLGETLRTKTEARDKMKAEVESDAYKNNKSNAEDWDATEEIRRCILNQGAENKVYSELVNELAMMNRKHLDIMSGIEWLKHAIEKKKIDKKGQEAYVEKNEGNAEMYANALKIKLLANTIGARSAESARWTAERKKIETRLEDSKKEELRRRENLKGAEETTEKQESEVKTLEEEVKALNLAELSKEVMALSDNIVRARQAMDCICAWNAAKEDSKEAESLVKETIEEQLRQQAALYEHMKRLPGLKNEYALKQAYLEGQMRLNDHIRDLRSRFAETKVCPLCGGFTEGLHDNDCLADYLKSAKGSEAKAKADLDNLTEKITAIQTILKTLDKALKTYKSTASAKRLAKDKAESAAKKAAPNYAEPEVIDKLENEITGLENKKAEKEKDLAKAKEQNDALNSARKSLDIQRNKKEEARKLLDTQVSLSNGLEKDIDTKKQLIFNAEKEADNALEEIKALVPESLNVTLQTAKGVSLDIEIQSKEYDNCKKRIEDLKDWIEKNEEKITSLEELEASVRDNFDLLDDVCPKEMPNLDSDMKKFVAKVNNISGRLHQTDERLSKLDEEINIYYSNPNSIAKERVGQLCELTPEEISNARKYVEDADKRFEAACASVSTVVEQIETHTKNRPEIEEGVTIEELESFRKIQSDERDALNKEHSAIAAQLDNDAKAAAALAEKCRLRETLRKEKDQWVALDRVFGGSDGKKFRNVAQSYVLRALLSQANQYLEMLNKRYELDCDDGSLTINVIDRYQGNAVRNVGLLSGGEGFIVSLALALGLSSISGNSLNVDTLFIDEGFGTLSSDYLETVVNTLDRLHQHSGRRVGIISHVEGLKERIPTQIRLQRTSPSTSSVTVVSV